MSKDMEKIIREIIRREGPITFARYMDLALYHPEAGYYNRPGEKIGPGGDFYTSPDVHSAFGQMLAEQFYEMWLLLKKPRRWHLVEFGAGKGNLARDVLLHLRNSYEQAYMSCRYCIVELSPRMRAAQRDLLHEQFPGRVSWFSKLSQIEERLKGCIYSNELVDAFSVHRVVCTPGGFKEIHVNYNGEGFFEENGDLSSEELVEYLNHLHYPPETGLILEINLAARNWLKDLSQQLAEGFLITIDYGFDAKSLANPMSAGGTLRCYHRHQIIDNPYLMPGQQDITTHVNFSDLRRWGEEYGLLTLGLTSQMNFLLNLDIMDTLKGAEYSLDQDKLRRTQAIKKLIMPGGMGQVFKVLVQGKNIPPGLRLKGLDGPFKKYRLS